VKQSHLKCYPYTIFIDAMVCISQWNSDEPQLFDTELSRFTKVSARNVAVHSIAYEKEREAREMWITLIITLSLQVAQNHSFLRSIMHGARPWNSEGESKERCKQKEKYPHHSHQTMITETRLIRDDCELNRKIKAHNLTQNTSE